MFIWTLSLSLSFSPSRDSLSVPPIRSLSLLRARARVGVQHIGEMLAAMFPDPARRAQLTSLSCYYCLRISDNLVASIPRLFPGVERTLRTRKRLSPLACGHACGCMRACMRMRLCAARVVLRDSEGGPPSLVHMPAPSAVRACENVSVCMCVSSPLLRPLFCPALLRSSALL